jgi:hypothetical protein
MSPPQQRFHEDQARLRFMIKANKVGGTRAGCAEAVGAAIGNHPYMTIPTPNMGLIVLPDLDTSYADDLCVCMDELIKPHDLHPKCTYRPEAGYRVGSRKGITFRNGSRIIFRSSHQDKRGLAGIFPDWVFVNEPPAKTLWGEIMRATFNKASPMWVLFTAVQDPDRASEDLSWFREEIEEPEKGWSSHRVPLTYENAPHRTREAIDAQIIGCPKWERAQRIEAKWDAPTIDRIFDGFTSATDEDPDRAVDVGLCFDHGERPGHEAALLYVFWREKGRTYVHVLDEYISAGRTTVEADALRVAEMLDRYGLTPMDVTRAHGDVNSAGKSALTSVNRALEIAFAKVCELPSHRPPFTIMQAKKGAGSIMQGAHVVNAAFLRGRLTVATRCATLVNSLRHWRGTKTGADEDYTHTIDALRYGLVGLLDPVVEAPAARVEVH